MNEHIKIIGFDPSLSNFGIAKTRVNIETLEVFVDDLSLIETQPVDRKSIIKTSDDLRRSQELVQRMTEHCDGYSIAISEVPFMNPAGYALANWNAAMMIGVLAACPIPMIQVSPQEVKLAAVNHRQAAKEEMIEWAMEKHPNAPWRTRMFKGKPRPTAANEHLADAVATVYAGLRTKEFENARAIMRMAKGVRA